MVKRDSGEGQELERCKRALLEALVGALEGGLRSESPRVRRKSARLLGGMGARGAAAAPLLEPLLGDKERRVREAAAWARDRIAGGGDPVRPGPGAVNKAWTGKAPAGYARAARPTPRGGITMPKTDTLELKADAEPTTKPAHEVRLGRIKATIWANENESGPWFNVRVGRLYKDWDAWKTAASFGREDLPLVAKVADMAHTWILQQGQE